MTIVETTKDDIELAHQILSVADGSQRFPVSWTVRLAAKVIQQNALIKSLTNQIKDLSGIAEDNGKIISTISSNLIR